MHTGTNNRDCDYFMNDQSFDKVTEHKDLGIIVSNSLRAEDHCHYVCNKANHMLGLIKRTVEYRNYTVLVQL